MKRRDVTNHAVYMNEPRGNNSLNYWILDGIKKLIKINIIDSDIDIMEKLASDILTYLGIDCINVELGIVGGKNCCIIDTFETESESLYDIIFDWKDINTGLTYEDIDLCFEQMFFNFENRLYNILHSELEEIKKSYIRMILGDCILGNFDRHLGNVGILYDEQKRKFRLAPSYDNAMAFKGYNLFKTYNCCIGKQNFKIQDVITYIVQNYSNIIRDIIIKLDVLSREGIKEILSNYEIDLGKEEYIIKYIRVVNTIIQQEAIKENEVDSQVLV